MLDWTLDNGLNKRMHAWFRPEQLFFHKPYYGRAFSNANLADPTPDKSII